MSDGTQPHGYSPVDPQWRAAFATQEIAHPATRTGLTLLERLDLIGWHLTREAAARIRTLEADLTAANGALAAHQRQPTVEDAP